MSIEIIKTNDKKLLSLLNEEVQNVHHEKYPDIFKPYSQKEMEKLFEWTLSENTFCHYIAKYNNDEAGYLIFEDKKYNETPYRYEYKVVYIHEISVLKKYQGFGIGKKFIDVVLKFANDNNIKRVEVDFWSLNDNAKIFYKKMGFCNYNERMFLKI
ncbi:MAG: GNAT family N-acetyltransferase [Spirochaetes bacterium]|nr:GNAT family N-acetyltransferase [Spirochaetota bacterium]